MVRPLGVVLLFAAVGAAQEPSPLDKVVPAKLPAAVRPPKGLPPDVIAVLGTRGDKIDCFSFRPDGKYLALSGPDRGLRVWDLSTLKAAALARMPDSVACVAFSPDGKLLAVGDERGIVRVFDKAEKAPALKATLAAHKDGPAWAVAFSPDGQTLATGGRDKAVRLWDMSKAKGPATAVLVGHEDEVRGVAFSPDGTRLYSIGGEDGQLWTWDVAKTKAVGSVKTRFRANGVAVSPDGKAMATAGTTGMTRLWALKDGLPTNPVLLAANGPEVRSVGFAPDGSALVGLVNHSPTEDRVQVWRPDGTKVRELVYEQHLSAAGFAPDGRHLVVVTEGPAYLVRLPR